MSISRHNPLSIKKSDLEVSEDTGFIVPKEGVNLYIKHLPNDITPEMLDKVDAYKTNFIASAKTALAEKAFDYLKGNPEVDSIKASVDMGETSTLSMKIKREDRVVVDGKEKVMYGSIVTTISNDFGPKEGNPILASDNYLAKLARANFKP